jgi:uncharacterized protein (TIGR02453 family)
MLPRMPGFDGFPRAAFGWFAGLEADNSRAYFTAHRDTYDNAVRGPLEELLEELADEHGGRVKVFRQHRDTRFSRDKSPYKTETYGLVYDIPATLAPIYVQASRLGLFAGTGYHGLARDQLARFRETVANDDGAAQALARAVAAAHDAGIETFGETLKTAPRGYPRDHPHATLLRHTELVAGRRIAPTRAGRITREAALALVHETWTACAPMNAWLDEHVGATDEPARVRPS